MNSIPFIAGRTPSRPQPLQEYLPKISPTILSTWLGRTSPHPNLLLDPFGSSPQSLIEAARNGYRVLAAINNPITRFLVSYASQSPTQADLKSALARLASAYKGQERLEPHILSLYETNCPQCGQTISAQAFIWKGKDTAPDRKICHCQHCHNQGEYPATRDDVAKAQEYQQNSLYHARALTRIAPPDDPVRSHAENALDLYTPRAVYALFTLINKLTGMSLQGEDRDHISALLLHAFYACNNLWSYPDRDQEMGGLSTPATYRERNVWHALEQAVAVWHQEEGPVHLTQWPDLPSVEGGISIYPGRFRDLAQELGEAFGAGIMIVPQPTPSFWSLSALWAGWLWGQEKAAPLRNILSLKEPDWPWHTRALQDTFENVSPFLTSQDPCFAVLPDVSPAFLSSTLSAAHTSGFEVQNIALDDHRKEAQIVWGQRERGESLPPEESPKAVLRNAGYSHLSERGEPSYTLLLHAAGITAMDREGAFPRVAGLDVADIYHNLVKELEETFAYRQGFLHYPESDTWWHQELTLDIIPLADQIETALVDRLVEASSPLSGIDLENELFESYPGLLTPNSALIQVCLDSYAEKVAPEGELWRLRDVERPQARTADISDMDGLLESLGARLGYAVKRKPPRGDIHVCTWNTEAGEAYTFFVSSSGILGKLVLSHPETPANPWIVLPGARADVVAFKLLHNPPLAQKIENHWNFLKYRHVRRLADDESLTRENITERLTLDPLKYDAPQLPLI